LGVKMVDKLVSKMEDLKGQVMALLMECMKVKS
jgi:hypothetical protein